KKVMTTRTLYADYYLAPDAPGVAQESISLTYDENTIRSIEPGEAPANESRKLLLPPLSNAHDHGRGLRTLAYGVPDQAVEAWVAATYLLPPVDPYLVAVTAFARMAKAGIGSVVHCHLSRAPGALVEEARAVRRAADDVGIRVAFVVP